MTVTDRLGFVLLTTSIFRSGIGNGFSSNTQSLTLSST